jgi:myosin protein heavy chain
MQALQLRLQELESRLDDEGRDSNELAVLRERLTEEIEDERRQHQQDIEERDQAIESTQKRYQGACLRSSGMAFAYASP